VRRLSTYLPWIVLVAFMAFFVPRNLRCEVYFAGGSTSALRFSFGWPVPYLQGFVPGPGLRQGSGPNRIWGHPEENDESYMQLIRSQEMAGLDATPWGMRRYGTIIIMGIVFDLLLLLAIWSAVWLACRWLMDQWEYRDPERKRAAFHRR
jgi:hypothetical protein